MRKLVHRPAYRRWRYNGTGFHERQRPTEYARRLIKTYGMPKAERVALAGERRAGKAHGGWFSAVYDATQTIKHSRAYNPRRKKGRKSKKRAVRRIRYNPSAKLKLRSYLKAIAARYGG